MHQDIPFIHIDDEPVRIARKRRSNTIHIHQHKYFELVYIFSGEGVLTFKGQTYEIERGDLLFFNIGDSHAVNPRSTINVVNIEVTPEFIDQELMDAHDEIDLLTFTSLSDFNDGITGFQPVIRFKGGELLEIERLIERLEKEYREQCRGYRTVVKSYIQVLLVQLLRYTVQQNQGMVRSDLSQAMPKIIAYIEANYNRTLTVKELAGISFYNPTYLGRMFRECYGESINEYIMGKRIADAKQRLKHSEESVEHISTNVGYKDPKQFYRAFKRIEGVTPGVYRKGIKRP